MRQSECAAQQSRAWSQEIEKRRERGGSLPEWNVRPLAADILAAELARPGSGNEAVLKEISELLSEYPYFDKKFYLKAGISVRLGQPGEAMAMLDQSLQDAAPGIFGLDIFGLTVEQSLLLDPLRGQAEFEDWQRRHIEQRKAVLQQMRRLENRGEIISVEAVKRLLSSP